MKALFTLFLSFTAASVCIAQWVQTSWNGGYSVRCFAVSDTNLFGGTNGGGVFLSTDNGTSWTAVNSGFPAYPWVEDLAVSGTNLFAGISRAYNDTTRRGVFLSTNNGTSWAAVNSGLTDTSVYALAASGTNLFAGTGDDDPYYRGGGVFLSTDNGWNWTAVNSGLTNTNVKALAVSGTNLFVGTAGGVFLSTNSGTSWTPVSSGLTDTSVYTLAVSDANLFAGTSSGVFLSTNSGTSWTAVNSGLPAHPIVLAFAVSGTNLFAGTRWGGVFLSTNSGTSWIAVNTGLTYYDVRALAVLGTNLFAGTANGFGIWRRPLSEMITDVPPASNELPTAFQLCQNYPNPFNPTTTIRYQLSTSSHVKLTVFDLLGRTVAILVDGLETAGYKSMRFDGNKLASGVYLYQLRAGSFVSTKKFVLLR